MIGFFFVFQVVSFNNSVVIRPIRQSNANGCKLQETRIGIKVADQGSGAYVVRLTPALTAAILLVFALQKLL